MKKQYIEPNVEVHFIALDHALLTTSGVELYQEEETNPVDEQLSRMLPDEFNM